MTGSSHAMSRSPVRELNISGTAGARLDILPKLLCGASLTQVLLTRRDQTRHTGLCQCELRAWMLDSLL